MEGGAKIYCGIIAKDDIILVEYFYPNDTLKDFLKGLLKEVKKGTSSLLSQDGFNFAYLNENSITYAALTTIDFNKATVVGFLESIKKAFDLSFPQKDFKNIEENCLNEKFQKTLIEKMNLFNENPECSSEEIIIEREKLSKQKDEILLQSCNNPLDERANKLSELEKRSNELSQDSKEFYKNSKRLRKKCIIF